MTGKRARKAVQTGTSVPLAGFSLISDERLLELYEAMLKSRQLERQRLTAVPPQRPLGLNWEATTAGVLLHLEPEDVLSPIDGSLSQRYLKGMPLRFLLDAEQAKPTLKPGVRKRANKHADKLNEAFHKAAADALILPALASPALVSPTLASPTTESQAIARLNERLSIAVGVALAHKLHHQTPVTIVFFEDEEAESNPSIRERKWIWPPAMLFAAAHQLSIIFVRCKGGIDSKENDAPRLSAASEPAPMPSIPVDAHDVVAVYRVAQEAITHAREGTGPTLIEAIAFNSSNAHPRHSSSPSSVDRAHDPILRMEAYLTGKRLYDPQMKRRILAGFNRELAAAILA